MYSFITRLTEESLSPDWIVGLMECSSIDPKKFMISKNEGISPEIDYNSIHFQNYEKDDLS